MTAAVLIIDMQNGFCNKGGSVIELMGSDFSAVSAATAQASALLHEARDADLPIVFTRHVCREGMQDARPRARAMASLAAPGVTPLLRGSWDADIVEQLAVRDDDVVIDKIRYDAFLYTELDAILRGAGITRLLVAGVVTSLCVDSSVRSAEQRGYDVFVAADACAGPSPAHEASLETMNGPFATVGPWRKLLADMINGAGRGD